MQQLTSDVVGLIRYDNPVKVEHFFQAHPELLTAPTGMDDAPTPMHVAVKYDRPGTVRALAGLGADVGVRNAAGWNLYHYAAFFGSSGVMPTLESLGLEGLDERDMVGDTPLYLATIRRKVAVIRMLRRLGSQAQDVAGDSGLSPLEYAASKGYRRTLQALEEGI